MKISGKVWKFGQDDINTDTIRLMVYSHMPYAEQAKHCMETVDPTFAAKVEPGDLIVAGKNSPYGNAIYAFDKGDIQPRIGITWDPMKTGRTILRSSYGMYYDQALVGIFEQNSFTNPPFVNTVSISNPQLSNPGAGVMATLTVVPGR